MPSNSRIMFEMRAISRKIGISYICNQSWGLNISFLTNLQGLTIGTLGFIWSFCLVKLPYYWYRKLIQWIRIIFAWDVNKRYVYRPKGEGGVGVVSSPFPAVHWRELVKPPRIDLLPLLTSLRYLPRASKLYQKHLRSISYRTENFRPTSTTIIEIGPRKRD